MDNEIENLIIDDLINESNSINNTKMNHFNNHTFDSFVIGESNKRSLLIATKVAKDPGYFVNPVYIFGSVGLGKTHLMQAIGNYISKMHNDLKILYIQAHEYLSDFNKAYVDKNFEAFEKKYSNIDVLLVDDIQLLERKNYTQGEFLKLFNEMINNNKQVVITSDRPVSKLNGFMDRLTSIFHMGIEVGIDAPDYELRKRVLVKLNRKKNLFLSDDVLSYVAKTFTKDVRELEVAINRILAFRDLYQKQEMDLEIVKKVLIDLTN